MEFKVIFRESFLHDLRRIVEAVAAHDPKAATRLGNLIVSRAEKLTFFPERYPRVRQRRGVRRFVAGRYFKVFYAIERETGTIEILRFWDGRRGSDPIVEIKP